MMMSGRVVSQGRHRYWLGHCIPGAAFEQASSACPVETTPLFEEKGYTGGKALIADVGHPLLVDRPCSGTGFTTYNHPVYPMPV
jgi:hypothetical protein